MLIGIGKETTILILSPGPPFGNTWVHLKGCKQGAVFIFGVLNHDPKNNFYTDSKLVSVCTQDFASKRSIS